MGYESTETVAGKTVTTESVGTLEDVMANLPGSKSDAEVNTVFNERREFPIGGYSKVAIKLGITKSLGNFEFARVDVLVEDFCLPTPEERTKTFELIQEEAKTVLGALARKILAARKGPLNG